MFVAKVPSTDEYNIFILIIYVRIEYDMIFKIIYVYVNTNNLFSFKYCLNVTIQ